MKRVCFFVLNYHSSLFYLAFFKRDVQRLRAQLATIMIVRQLINTLLEVLWPYIAEKLKMKSAIHLAKQQPDGGAAHDDNDAANYNAEGIHFDEAWERDSAKQTPPDPFDEFIETYVQFSYVVCFGWCWPLVSVCALFGTFCELRFDFFKYFAMFRRPEYRYVSQIAFWGFAMECMAVFAVMTNCAFLVVYTFLYKHEQKAVSAFDGLDALLSDTSVAGKLSDVVIGEHLLLLFILLVGRSMSTEPGKLRMLRLRREFYRLAQETEALRSSHSLAMRQQLAVELGDNAEQQVAASANANAIAAADGKDLDQESLKRLLQQCWGRAQLEMDGGPQKMQRAKVRQLAAAAGLTATQAAQLAALDEDLNDDETSFDEYWALVSRTMAAAPAAAAAAAPAVALANKDGGLRAEPIWSSMMKKKKKKAQEAKSVSSFSMGGGGGGLSSGALLDHAFQRAQSQRAEKAATSALAAAQSPPSAAAVQSSALPLADPKAVSSPSFTSINDAVYAASQVAAAAEAQSKQLQQVQKHAHASSSAPTGGSLAQRAGRFLGQLCAPFTAAFRAGANDASSSSGGSSSSIGGGGAVTDNALRMAFVYAAAAHRLRTAAPAVPSAQAFRRTPLKKSM
jgi:hypothetical protein